MAFQRITWQKKGNKHNIRNKDKLKKDTKICQIKVEKDSHCLSASLENKHGTSWTLPQSNLLINVCNFQFNLTLTTVLVIEGSNRKNRWLKYHLNPFVIQSLQFSCIPREIHQNQWIGSLATAKGNNDACRLEYKWSSSGCCTALC